MTYKEAVALAKKDAKEARLGGLKQYRSGPIDRNGDESIKSNGSVNEGRWQSRLAAMFFLKCDSIEPSSTACFLHRPLVW